MRQLNFLTSAGRGISAASLLRWSMDSRNKNVTNVERDVPFGRGGNELPHKLPPLLLATHSACCRVHQSCLSQCHDGWHVSTAACIGGAQGEVHAEGTPSQAYIAASTAASPCPAGAPPLLCRCCLLCKVVGGCLQNRRLVPCIHRQSILVLDPLAHRPALSNPRGCIRGREAQQRIDTGSAAHRVALFLICKPRSSATGPA